MDQNRLEKREGDAHRRVGEVSPNEEELRRNQFRLFQENQQLRQKLNAATIQSQSDRLNRQAALNLMEDAVEARNALAESEQRFRSLVEANAQAVWETNAKGKVVDDSPSWRAFTGQSLEEWLKNGWVDAIHPEDQEYAFSGWQRAIERSTSVNAEFRIKNAQGEWRWTNARATPIRSPDGTILKWSGMNIDIHDRKLAEQRLHLLNTELDQLVRERTHQLELNEVALRDRAEQLQAMAIQLTRAEQVERRKLSEILHDHVQQLLVTIKMRLGILKVSLSTPTQQQHAGNIEHVLNECLNATRTLAVELQPPLLHDQGLPAALEWLISIVKSDRGLNVTSMIDPAANPATIEQREVLFHTARELLLNVVKHSKVNEAVLSLKSAPNQISLTISDQGIGFKTLKNLPDRNSFGLSQIHQRLHAISGVLDITSKPNHGTAITATLRC